MRFFLHCFISVFSVYSAARSYLTLSVVVCWHLVHFVRLSFMLIRIRIRFHFEQRAHIYFINPRNLLRFWTCTDTCRRMCLCVCMCARVCVCVCTKLIQSGQHSQLDFIRVHYTHANDKYRRSRLRCIIASIWASEWANIRLIEYMHTWPMRKVYNKHIHRNYIKILTDSGLVADT